MSLEVRLVSVTHLKGKYDRFAKVTFRGVPFTSEILPNSSSTAYFDQVFSWPLSSFLEPEESVEIRIYNSNKVFQDRLVGVYTQSLAIAVAQGHLEVCDNLLSSKLRVLRQEVKFVIKYFKPGPADFYDDTDNREDARSRRSFRSTVTSRSQPHSESGVPGGFNLLEEKELYHPKIYQPAVVNPVPSEWQIQLRIIEARELAGMNLDPVVTIRLAEQTKHTTVKPQTNNPIWDEFFCFDLMLPQQQAMDQILMLDVYTGRNIISQGTVVGSFKLDLWYIYRKQDHCIFSKWAPLVDGANTECRGYLRLDICVFGKGDVQRDPPQRKDKDEDIELNLIYPEHVLLCRPVYKYIFKIYKAEGLPQMNAKLMANFKKALTRKVQDMADPFVEVTFAGVKGKTSVKKNTYKPEFNEQIIFTEFFPALCRTIKIQIKDSDAVSDEVIGTHNLDIEMILNEDPTVGFLPSFGPSWLNFYGSTRDYSMFDEHIDLNNGIGEGISYRGRLLMAIECYEDQPDDTGTVSLDEVASLRPNETGREQPHFLFATFYEASMIPKKLGDKPIQFEVTIGEFGVYLEDEAATAKNGRVQSPTANFDYIDGEDEFINEPVYTRTTTKPMKPQCLAGQKYYSIPWDSDKPCTFVKFPFEDQRRRTYNAIMLAKMFNTLEENLEEMDERDRLQLKNNHHLFRRFMGDIVHMAKLFIDLADGKKTGTHLGKNRLDRERLKMCLYEVHNISVKAGEIGSKCTESNVSEQLKVAHSLLRRLKNIVHDPQHTLPDVFVWMISGGKRVAYTRIPAADVFFSKVDFERGRNAGRVQTIFLRLPGKRGHGEKGWAIQAKIEVRFWLGLLNQHQGEYWRDIPSGYERPEDMMLSVPPTNLVYYEKQKFAIRAHIYQARSLIGSDDSGLSDAFARVICSNQLHETYVVWKTRSPTWDQMLKFEGIELWGELAEFAVNPPVIVIEIFDKDDDLFGGGDVEFIGRALAKPVVKAADEAYEKPFFPPVLQWFPIYRGETKAGELLAAFEMFQITEDMDPECLPLDPELTNTDDGLKMFIPESIRPVMTKHRVEVMFWGVREMKRAQLMSINRPQVEMDCCYTVQLLDGSEKSCVQSIVCKDASKNPNFDNPVVVFDVDLPQNKKYIPPVTIRVNDIRAFGRKILCGTHVIDSLQDYFRDVEDFHRKKEEEIPDGKKKKPDEDGDIAIEIPDTPEVATATPEKKVKKKEDPDKEEEILDWWTRFYETLRDMQEQSKPKPKLVSFGSKSPTPEKKPAGERIPRLTVYETELEDIDGFDRFNDFMETFTLLRGKKTEEEDDEIRRFSGKFKGNIRVWKNGLPRGFEESDPKGTFYKLPSNDPIRVLVRVYVIRCLNLHPTDPNGKADPYLVVSLGKKTHKDRENYVSKQLSPEFGRVFEFEAKLPFDNMLTVQVYDWDMMSGDDLIGETEVDIENLFYSKHRATCGIQENFVTHGYAKWRDPQKPTQILTKLCKDEGLDGPTFDNGVCTVEGVEFTAASTIKDVKGREKPSDEPCALEALRNFSKIPRGYALVPEYVETRSLLNPEKPGLEQGRVQLWVDMFPMDLTMPGPPVDVTPRKPTEYELRLIVWNTDSVVMDEVNIMGERSSDIYVKGWLEGNKEHRQETDVHYRSTDGSGMFNWRFVFQFMFHKAEEKIVTRKKASIFSVDLTEEKHPPNLYLQVWDADLISADDILGDFIAPLTKLPSPAKSAKSCDLKMLTDESRFGSIIKAKHMKGWWPFQFNPDDDDDPNPVLTGKVEVELELLTKEDAEATPAGKAREEPQPLSKPNRPSDSMSLFMSPLKMLKYFLWDSYKWCLLKALVVFLLLALMGLFFYSMPGYTVKKIFGA